MNNKENINTILRKPKKQPRILSIKPRFFMDKILDKKLNMKDKIRKINKKALIPAIKSIITVSFKKPDKTILIFSKDIQARYKDNNHLVKDKNSFTKPLDKPKKDEKIVKERKIKSAIGIKII